jgi:NAD(P)-dependent dehydrogenase (short-subunit alcohol dehydrogenase family)
MECKGRNMVVVGGTRGLGFAIARAAVARDYMVTITGRSAASAERAAAAIGANCTGKPCDLNDLSSIETFYAEVDRIDHLLLVAVDRDHNEIRSFRAEEAARTASAKTIGYASSVHRALNKFTDEASVVLFGGISASRPLPGSTTISMANGAVIGLMNSLAAQIAPVRVNTLTPGIVEDTDAVVSADPIRSDAYDALRARTPGHRLPSTDDIVQAAFALIDNPGINALELVVDAGMRIA